MNESSFLVDLQIAVEDTNNLPEQAQFETWVKAILIEFQDSAELTVRIVEASESQMLNRTYRGKDKPTNVLSFPSDSHDSLDVRLLGDLIICKQVVEKEVQDQNKSLESHWAHMIIHGCLHLLGYDHEEEDEAVEMESIETEVMQKLGFDDPYLNDEIIGN